MLLEIAIGGQAYGMEVLTIGIGRGLRHGWPLKAELQALEDVAVTCLGIILIERIIMAHELNSLISR